ncbi:MAG TPA: MFS transporter, partial [Desulfobacteraceae bacterium]|nr:MFS transporter [Desulfobacteraceae bacterium]
IPEHFPADKITRINGRLKMFTTLGILIGIACAGIALDFRSPVFVAVPAGQILIACTVILISAAGLIASLGITEYQAAAPDKPFPWAGPFHSLRDVFALRKDPLLLLAVLSDAFFYFLAALVVLVINTYGIDQLGLSRTVTSMMSVALMVGVSLGAVFASRIADTTNWTKVLLPGTSGMAAGLAAAALSVYVPEEQRVAALFASFILTGFCGGFFLIPITSFIQVRPKDSDKGQVIAVVGFCSFIGILLAGRIYTVLDGLMEPGTMLFCTGLTSFSAALILMVLLRWNSSIVRNILHLVIRGLLRLRYDIEVAGLEKVEKSNIGEGILFLPNHPAWIDPVIIMTILHGKFQPRPLADYEETNKWYIRPLMRLVHAIRIPSLAKNGRGSKDEITNGINRVAASLRAGDNVILYPAGRLYRSMYEQLGAKSAVHTILAENTGQRIVLVRTGGLWGSSFSWADGSPRLSRRWKTYLSFALANCLFFGPRRKVTVELAEPVYFPRHDDRITINQALEQFYNVDALPNLQVPYFWWQGSNPIARPDPEDQAVVRDLANVPESIKTQVKDHLQEVNKIPAVAMEDKLAGDIGMDSLALMELAAWLEKEFGMPIEDLESIRTVGDVALAACGQGVGTGEEKKQAVHPAWFRGDARKDLSLSWTESICQAFLGKAKAHPDKAIVADRISGVKTYRQFVMATMILQKKLRAIDSPNLGIMLPASVSASLCYFAALFAEKTPVMLN